MATPASPRRIPSVLCLLAFLVGSTQLAVGQQPGVGALKLPPDTIALEGVPDVQVEATREQATRRALDPATSAQHRLTIRLADGRLFWAGAGNEPVTVSSSGAFVYLQSREPGKYVRIRRVNDRLS